jgi:cyclic di-GMP phosphodiesterase
MTMNYVTDESQGEQMLSSTVQCDAASKTIMVVDDVPLNVKLACAHLSAVGYSKFVSVTDSTSAMARLYQDAPDLLLLDLMMPQVSGIDILEAIRADERFSHLPILILTAATDRELKIQALELGATDFLNKPLDAEDLIPRVRNALLNKSYQDDLEGMVRQRTEELAEAQREVVQCLARASEYRDNETGKHVIRVGRYVAIIARELGLDPDTVELMRQASTLHDIGKIGIVDGVLLKPGKLTPEEFNEMKRHCAYGEDICTNSVPPDASTSPSHVSLGTEFLRDCKSPLLKMASRIAASHHEKWDGSGYPLGLKGESIPLEGRITAVADVFDALSSKRPYKEPFPLEKCIDILREGRGQHFESKLVDLFLRCLDEVVSIRKEFADE